MHHGQTTSRTDMQAYSERDAAKAIGVSISTLRRARQAGRLRFYRIGARVLYSREHLVEFLESTERSAVGAGR